MEPNAQPHSQPRPAQPSAVAPSAAAAPTDPAGSSSAAFQRMQDAAARVAVQSAPPPRIVDVLEFMNKHRASDAFVSVGAPIVVKVRGSHEVVGPRRPLSSTEIRDLVLSTMNDRVRARFESERDANFALSELSGGRFRVSAFFQKGEPGMVIRRIETRIPSLTELGLPDSMERLVMQKRGIVLFVGATGTGKSSSLAALVNYRNHNSRGHIITIEDPIEFIHEHHGCVVDQREVGVDTPSWDQALQNTLRQAPDVILIGEVRARETMEHAINFSETGHLVLCTLHANNAAQALDRIINFFPKDRHAQLLMDLSFNLHGIVAQQLVPTVDGTLRAVVEVMVATPAVKELIKMGEISRIREIMANHQDDMQTFDDELVRLHLEGVISLEQAARHADVASNVTNRVRLHRRDSDESIASRFKMDKDGDHDGFR